MQQRRFSFNNRGDAYVVGGLCDLPHKIVKIKHIIFCILVDFFLHQFMVIFLCEGEHKIQAEDEQKTYIQTMIETQRSIKWKYLNKVHQT